MKIIVSEGNALRARADTVDLVHRRQRPSILEGVAKLIARVTGPRVQKCRASAKFLGHTLSGTGSQPPPNGGGLELG